MSSERMGIQPLRVENFVLLRQLSNEDMLDISISVGEDFNLDEEGFSTTR